MTTTPRGTAWLPYGLLLLAVLALVLVVAGVRGRRPVVSVPSREGYFASWATIHGVAPSGLVAWWLGRVYAAARPLAIAGVSPTVLTLAGVVVAGLVPCVAVVGPRWPVAAGFLVGASGLLDSLDGAVAVLTDRVSAWGSVLDSLVDRLSDALYLLAFWLLGAAGWLFVVAGVALGLLEYARARAGYAGMKDVGVVTVGERPTRVIIAATFLVTAGVLPSRADAVAAVAVGLTGAVCLIGLAQLLVVVRRALGGQT